MNIISSYKQSEEITISKTKDMLEEFEREINDTGATYIELYKLYSKRIIEILDLKEYTAYYIGIKDTNRFVVMQVCSKSFLKIRVFRHWIGRGLLDKPVSQSIKDKTYTLFSIYKEITKEENSAKIKQFNKNICDIKQDTSYVINACSKIIKFDCKDFDMLTVYVYLKDNENNKENPNLLLLFRKIRKGKCEEGYYCDERYYVVKFSNNTVFEIRKSEFDYLDLKTNLLGLVLSSFDIERYLKCIKGELKETDYTLIAQAKMIEALGIKIRFEVTLNGDVFIMKNKL